MFTDITPEAKCISFFLTPNHLVLFFKSSYRSRVSLIRNSSHSLRTLRKNVKLTELRTASPFFLVKCTPLQLIAATDCCCHYESFPIRCCREFFWKDGDGVRYSVVALFSYNGSLTLVRVDIPILLCVWKCFSILNIWYWGLLLYSFIECIITNKYMRRMNPLEISVISAGWPIVDKSKLNVRCKIRRFISSIQRWPNRIRLDVHN